MKDVFLLLGSNQGDRWAWLQLAMQQIIISCGAITNQSAVYETAAWGQEHQPEFLNMAIGLSTELSPIELLRQTQIIEAAAGRDRTIKWGQRTLDIDLLFYGQTIIQSDELTIPHPYLHERKFTLAPLADIAPHFIHPLLHMSVSTLNKVCVDPLPVKKFDPLT